MKKYTVKTIIDYINGNDIENFTLEELEDNMEFMKSVINYTNDKNMLTMCSTRLQNDFEFIKFIIYKFCQDIDFIIPIADKFLASIDKEQEMNRYELAIIMCSLITDKERSFKYQLIATIAFQWEIECVLQCKAKYEGDNSKFGEGFIFISQDDDNSPIMVEYFAKRFISYIFTLYDIDFEDLLHKRFSTKEELEQVKINEFLTNFLSYYDASLASYARVHLQILNSLKEQIKMTIQNWDNYIARKERDLYNLLFEKVSKYRQEQDCLLQEDDLLYSIGLELGIADKIKKYNWWQEEDESPSVIDKESLDFDEKLHYYAIKKLMLSIINGSYIEEEDYTSNNVENKIIAIDFASPQKKG